MKKEKPKKYSIQITYDTGDTFHNEYGLTRNLDLQWDDLEKAKQAVKDIESHYKNHIHLKYNYDVSKKEQKKIRENLSNHPWYKKPNSCGYWELAIMLENDEGERVYESAFWTGYFESLVGAEIVENKDDLSKYSYRTR